ncbi:MAG: HlyD family secretion protein [Acidobacteria bacterium]|nr:HlyD family secretion protein [Acidobacteriota bacterium]
MEIILLLIYAFFVWLIFFKFKLLPWNIVSQVIVITLPIIALTVLILLLNIVAPSSSDVRVINYVVQIVPRVSGRVIEVPVEPNKPVKKGDVLFKIDPVPFEQQIATLEARIPQLNAKLASAQAYQRELGDTKRVATAKRSEASAVVASARSYKDQLGDELDAAVNKKQSIAAKLELARMRYNQTKELAEAGAGPRFDFEYAAAEVKNLEAELAAAAANEAQVRQKLTVAGEGEDLPEIEKAKAAYAAATASEAQAGQKLSARTSSGEFADIAEVKAELDEVLAKLEEAKWNLSQTTVYAPADGTVVNLQLRPGSYAVPLPLAPVMSFVENEQWIIALYHQNELRLIQPGDDAEITLETHPNQIIKCKVDSIVWASGQGQSPISGRIPETGANPIPEGRFAVRILPDGDSANEFFAAGARGHGAVYTQSGHIIHILRKVILRVSTKLDWFILKLH